MRGQNNNAIAHELLTVVPEAPQQQQQGAPAMPQQMPQQMPAMPMQPPGMDLFSAPGQVDANGQTVIAAPMPQGQPMQMPPQQHQQPQVGHAQPQAGELSQADAAYLNERVPQLLALAKRILVRNGNLGPAQKNYIASQAAIALVGQGGPGFEAARRYALRMM